MTVPNYVTLADVKAYWPENEVSTSDKFDVLINTLCTTLSRTFDLQTWRVPGDFAVSDTVSKYFDGVPPTATDYQGILNVGEIAEITSIYKDGNLVQPSDYWPYPYNAALEYAPYTSLRLNPEGQTKSWSSKLRGIVVTGKYGYSTTVPPDVKQALLLYVVKLVRKAQQNYMDTGVILDSGQLMLGTKPDSDLDNLILLRRKSTLPSGRPSTAVSVW